MVKSSKHHPYHNLLASIVLISLGQLHGGGFKNEEFAARISQEA